MNQPEERYWGYGVPTGSVPRVGYGRLDVPEKWPPIDMAKGEPVKAAQNTPLADLSGQKEDPLDGQEFYELMQTYRHTPAHRISDVARAFEAVKAFARSWR